MRITKFIIIFSFLCFKGFADNSPLSKLKSGIHKITPFHLIKNTTEKISKFGLEKLFYGVASLFIVTEAYEAGLFDTNEITKDKNNNYEKSSLQRIKSKGQVYLNGIDEVEAKRRALDDALYFAAIKGGVEVHGFSSIDTETKITENFTVKPESKILDYNILKSYKENDIYIVEIEAFVGSITSKIICNQRENIIVKEFKGSKTLVSNLPQEIDSYIHFLPSQVSKNLMNDKKVTYIGNKNKYFDFNEKNIDKSFDYIALVNGTDDINFGDFIYIPSIKIYKTKIYPKTFLIQDNKIPLLENSKFFDADAIKVEFSADLYNGLSNTIIENIRQNYLIPINTDSNFEIIKLFTKVDREYINKEFINISYDISKIIKETLFCEPISATLQLVNKDLKVPLGTSHGLRKNQLAVIDSDTNNWTMLSISEINFNNSTLEPLNSDIDIKELLGKKTRFLE